MPVFDPKKQYNTITMIVIGSVVAAVLIGVFLVGPSWNRVKALGAEVPAEELNRDRAKADATNLESAKKFFTEQKAAVDRVNTAVPIQPKVPNSLAILEGLAKQNGVLLTSFSPQLAAAGATAQAGVPESAVIPGGADSLEINAQYSGSYTALVNFLYSLERSLRFVDVKTLSVTTSATGQLEGALTFRTYYKQVEGGPVASTAPPK